MYPSIAARSKHAITSLQEPSELRKNCWNSLSVSLLPVTLGDVQNNRHGRSFDLTLQAPSFTLRELFAQAVNLKGQLQSLLIHDQVPKVSDWFDASATPAVFWSLTSHVQLPTSTVLRVFVGDTVSGTISLPLLGFFSPFPHGTGSLSVVCEYLALEGGPPGFRRGFSCPALLRNEDRPNEQLTLTGLSPSLVGLSRPFRFAVRPDGGSAAPPISALQPR